jgi:hypothetical protein
MAKSFCVKVRKWECKKARKFTLDPQKQRGFDEDQCRGGPPLPPGLFVDWWSPRLKNEKALPLPGKGFSMKWANTAPEAR